MNLFLLRHFESEKNVCEKLSNGKNDELLTDEGKRLCSEFSGQFRAFCNRNNIGIKTIHCADSARAIETANIISHDTHTSIKPHKDLLSTDSGNLKGKTIQEIKRIDTFFSDNYFLYRKGLLNLYYFDEKWDDPNKETKRSFENRIIAQFLEILSDNEDTLIVGHRASITAILIYIAREMGIYPEGYYGHILVELGKISWITYDACNWNFKLINDNIQVMRNE